MCICLESASQSNVDILCCNLFHQNFFLLSVVVLSLSRNSDTMSEDMLLLNLVAGEDLETDLLYLNILIIGISIFIQLQVMEINFKICDFASDATRNLQNNW